MQHTEITKEKKCHRIRLILRLSFLKCYDPKIF
jgi:hypothetical protein